MRQDEFWNKPEVIQEFQTAPAQQYWEDFFIKLKDRKHKKVLDLGCGAGRYTELLVKLGFQVWALDSSKGMLSVARKRLLNFKNRPKFSLGDMRKLPYKNEYFDLILSNGLFHNAEKLHDLELSILEASRVLKQRGYMCVNMFYRGRNNKSLRRVETNIFLTKDNLYITLLKKKKLLKLFKKHNLILLTESINHYPRYLNVGRRDVFRCICIKKYPSF